MRKVRIDLKDLCRLKGRYTWYIKDNGYIAADKSVDGVRRHFYLHRLVLGAVKGTVVDHIDGDRLNNARHNLRVCTQAQNLQNRDTGSKYRGVYLDPRQGYFYVKCGKLSLGSYLREDDAAAVYNWAALLLYGAKVTRQNDTPVTWHKGLEVYSNNQTGYKGVDFHRLSGRYNARYRRKSLGYYTTAKEAHAVWLNAHWADLYDRILKYRRVIGVG